MPFFIVGVMMVDFQALGNTSVERDRLKTKAIKGARRSEQFFKSKMGRESEAQNLLGRCRIDSAMESAVTRVNLFIVLDRGASQKDRKENFSVASLTSATLRSKCSCSSCAEGGKEREEPLPIRLLIDFHKARGELC